MKDEDVLDVLIEVVERLSQTPALPPNPHLPEITFKLTALKKARQESKKKFQDHINSVNSILKKISNIDLND